MHNYSKKGHEISARHFSCIILVSFKPNEGLKKACISMASMDALGKLLSTQEAPTHPELEEHMLNYKIFLKTPVQRPVFSSNLC